jgi:hypothetical protein
MARYRLYRFAIASLALISTLPICLAAQPASAFVLKATLTDITFQDELDPLSAVTANGSFDYDTIANRYSNINIAMSDGVTFSPADAFGGDSVRFEVEKSPTGPKLLLSFFTPLTDVTPPDFVELATGADPSTCFTTVGSCYLSLATFPAALPTLAEESIDVAEVPMPPALVGTLLGAGLGIGSRFKKKLADVNKA